MSWLSSTHRFRAAVLALVVGLLLVGCDPGIPASSPSLTPDTAELSDSAQRDHGKALYERFLRVDWSILTGGGLGPTEQPPEALGNLLAGDALEQTLDYYRWVHTEGIRFSGQPPELVEANPDRYRYTGPQFQGCVDWSGVVMQTERIGEWRGKVRGITVSVESDRIAFYEEQLCKKY